MGAVAGFAAVDIGGFAYAGGWLRPGTLNPARFADRFEQSTAAMTVSGATMPKVSVPQELSRATAPARPSAGRRSSSPEVSR